MINSRLVIRNTSFLYLRMILVMAVSLYTSRIILNVLGVSDFGLYNLIGGFIAMAGFLNGAMATATQRYLSFDIGLGDFNKLQKTFSSTLIIHIGIALIVFIFAETIGLWYINNLMVFPEGRSIAVNVVYQFSILTFLLSVIQVPYNALVLARERMKIYAIFSFIEVALKLVLALSLMHFGSDKLISYAILSFVIALVIRLLYQVYCRRNFKESIYKYVYDKIFLLELISYSGWNLFGSISVLLKNHGANIILNLFFGTIVNAAYGLTMQVQSAVSQFVINFQAALNPQIIQNYASGDKSKSLNMIFLGSKFSFIIMLFVLLPVIYNINYILELWLGNVPQNTQDFVKLSLISLLIDSVSGPFMTGIQASGKIKKYQIIVGGVNLLILPLIYFLLKLGYAAIIVFHVLIFFSLMSLLLRFYFLKLNYECSFKRFAFKILLPMSILMLMNYITYLLLSNYTINDNLNNLVFSTICFLLLNFILSLGLMFSKGERKSLFALIKSKI